MVGGNEETRETIGKRIERLRKEKGVKQQEMADALFVDRVTVSQWENGARDIKTGNMVSIAEYFGVSCDYLLGRTRTTAPDDFIQAVCQRFGLGEQELLNLERMTLLARLYEKHQRLTDGIAEHELTLIDKRKDNPPEEFFMGVLDEQDKLKLERAALETEMLELIEPGEGYFYLPRWHAPIRCQEAWQRLHAISVLLTLEQGEKALNEMGEYLYMSEITDGIIRTSNDTFQRLISGEDLGKIKLFKMQECLVKMRVYLLHNTGNKKGGADNGEHNKAAE